MRESEFCDYKIIEAMKHVCIYKIEKHKFQGKNEFYEIYVGNPFYLVITNVSL